jgi:FhuF 2Fe-2S C-terminal domain/Ferric iron reductase FhuF-like transporter
MSGAELRSVAAAVQERVSYLTCATEAPAAEGWIGCSELVTDPALVRREIEATLPGRRTDDLQVAASLYAQSYAYRVASLAVAAYALELPSPSCDPAALAIQVQRHRPARIAVLDPVCRSVDASKLARELLDGHLSPFIGTVRESTRIGQRLLWGNVASALASIFGAAHATGPCGDPAVRQRAGTFLAAAEPWLGGLGEWTHLEAPGAFGWYWNRTSCCLWYQTDGGWYCEDCSLHDRAELEAARAAALVGSDRA